MLKIALHLYYLIDNNLFSSAFSLYNSSLKPLFPIPKLLFDYIVILQAVCFFYFETKIPKALVALPSIVC